MLIPMKADRVILDPLTKSPVLFLSETGGARSLPIWIGHAEAIAIAFSLEGIDPPRPLTHDLLIRILEALQASVQRVVIRSLEDNTYYATLFLDRQGEEIPMDSRPSDAVALALRARAPILVDDELLKESKKLEVIEAESEEEAQKLKEYLDSLGPDDIGKYKM